MLLTTVPLSTRQEPVELNAVDTLLFHTTGGCLAGSE